MVSFSNDVDILRYEPILFGEFYLPSQVLAEGTGGVLDGTSFACSAADFVDVQVLPGGVIYLKTADNVLDGAYEIVSVDSPSQLGISIVRSDSEQAAIAPPAAEDVNWRISTFGPQAAEAGFQLTEYFGIRPGNPASDYDATDILDSSVLRQASVFAVISSVYAMLASKSENDNFWKKSLHYRHLFNAAKGRCRLSIDRGGDGISDVTKIGSCSRLVRD
jgi:hypothetical protein